MPDDLPPTTWIAPADAAARLAEIRAKQHAIRGAVDASPMGRLRATREAAADAAAAIRAETADLVLAARLVTALEAILAGDVDRAEADLDLMPADAVERLADAGLLLDSLGRGSLERRRA